MGPREEDNSLLLLGAVAFICGLIAFVPPLLESTPAQAGRNADHPSGQPPSDIRDLVPARVIVPFTPNTIPGER